jgi:hypothetical protein
MKKFLKCTASILAGLCIFAACSDDSNNEVEEVTIFVDHSSLDLFVGEQVQITASPTGETFEWKSDNPAVATVSAGLVIAMGEGTTSIVVSCRDAKLTIPVSVKERIPATGISVSESSLTLKPGETVPLTASLLPANNNEVNPVILWRSSDEDVVTVTSAGVVEAIDYGSTTITVSLEGTPSIKTEILVVVSPGMTVVDVSTFVESGIPNILYSQVSFTKDDEFLITGIEASEIAAAYNRDFFNYDAGTLTFTGETGVWDVFYSSRYHYFWVGKMDAVYPDAVWILGCGFSCAPWHSDFINLGWWSDTDIRQLAYMKNLGNNRYQATIYISSQSVNEENDILFYEFPAQIRSSSPLTADPTLTGDTVGMSYGVGTIWPVPRGLVSVGVNGHYRITLDLSGDWGVAAAHVEKLND